MITLYILNTILLIIAIIAICMQFCVLKTQKELTDMNNIVLGMNELFTEGKLIVREPDCSLRSVSVHTAIRDYEPILVLDLYDEKKEKK